MNVLVYLLGAINLAFGVYALFAPQAAAELSELGIESAKATAEYRTVFGGLIIGLGGAMLLAPTRPDPRPWMLALALLFAGLVLGRLVSLALDGVTLYTAGLGAVEAACGVVLWLAARPSA